jgi:hypothetical protein
MLFIIITIKIYNMPPILMVTQIYIFNKFSPNIKSDDNMSVKVGWKVKCYCNNIKINMFYLDKIIIGNSISTMHKFHHKIVNNCHYHHRHNIQFLSYFLHKNHHTIYKM